MASRTFLNFVASLLCAGGVLITLPSYAETPLTRATIQRIRNDVDLKPQQQSKRDARVNDVMTPGDALQTFRRAMAELRFNDSSVARIGEHAVFNFQPNTRELELKSGTVLLLIQPGQGRTRVRTPNAAAGIRGSALFVRHIPDSKVTMVGALTNSDIEISNSDGTQTVVLKAGQMGYVHNNQIGVFNFDQKLFQETSPFFKDIDWNEAPAAVKEEIDAALQSQSAIAGDYQDTPTWTKLADNRPPTAPVANLSNPQPQTDRQAGEILAATMAGQSGPTARQENGIQSQPNLGLSTGPQSLPNPGINPLPTEVSSVTAPANLPQGLPGATTPPPSNSPAPLPDIRPVPTPAAIAPPPQTPPPAVVPPISTPPQTPPPAVVPPTNTPPVGQIPTPQPVVPTPPLPPTPPPVSSIPTDSNPPTRPVPSGTIPAIPNPGTGAPAIPAVPGNTIATPVAPTPQLPPPIVQQPIAPITPPAPTPVAPPPVPVTPPAPPPVVTIVPPAPTPPVPPPPVSAVVPTPPVPAPVPAPVPTPPPVSAAPVVPPPPAPAPAPPVTPPTPVVTTPPPAPTPAPTPIAAPTDLSPVSLPSTPPAPAPTANVPTTPVINPATGAVTQ